MLILMMIRLSTIYAEDKIIDIPSQIEGYYKGSLSNESDSIKIVRENENRIYFEINTVGGNYHSCSITGYANLKKGYFEHINPTIKTKPDCHLKIWYLSGELSIEDIGGYCRFMHCGARAGLQSNFPIDVHIN